MRTTTLFSAMLAVALLSPVPARSHVAPSERVAVLLAQGAADLGSPMGAPLYVPEPEGEVVAQDAGPVETVETLTNFDYSELISRREALRRTIRTRRGERRVVPANSGVIEADRVDQGQISEVVVHASLGSGACEGTVNYLLRVRQAAHFMVCRNGRIYQMVDIANIANHVRSPAVAARSVGIETESGHLRVAATDRRGRPITRRAVTEEEVFWTEDWSPKDFWPMYASMATLIRAIHRETRLPRDVAHIRTHEAVDAGITGAHTDPGGVFDGSRGHVYPEFAQRYPNENVSPYQWLMRLVNDDTPPAILAVLTAPARYQVRDTDNLGLAHVRLWSVNEAGAAVTKLSEWTAQPGTFPDVQHETPAPTTPGRYRIVARDLVGNITGAEFRVDASGPGGAAVASAASPLDLSSERALAALEPGFEPAAPVRLAGGAASLHGSRAVGAP